MASPSQREPKRRLDAFRLTLIGFAAVAGFLFLGGFAYFKYYSASRAAERAREVNRIRQTGLPTDLEELARFYFVDGEADRLGAELVRGLASFNTTWEIYDNVHFIDRFADIGERLTPENAEVLRALLDDNGQYLAEIRRLVNIPHEVRYPLDFSQGFQLEFRFAPDVRIAVRMFAADAQIAALDGDAARVVQDSIDAIKTAETLRAAPILILQLVRIACQGIVFDRLEYTINGIAIPRESLQRLREALRQLVLDGATVRGMIGERCLADVLFLQEAEDQSKIAEFLKKYRTFPDIWSANLFLTHSEFMRIGDLPPWERHAATAEATERLKKQWTLFHVFEQLLIPAMGRAYDAETRVLGILAATQTGLAVLDYAGSAGALPENLSALVPEYLESVPLDPFDGQPLRYRLTETGFVVYSIAHNRVDDGGVLPPEGKKVTETGDLVFRVLDASPYVQQKGAA